MVARIWYIELISSSEKPITLRALITALWLVRSLLVVFREKNKDFALKKCQYRSVQKKKHEAKFFLMFLKGKEIA